MYGGQIMATTTATEWSNGSIANIHTAVSPPENGTLSQTDTSIKIGVCILYCIFALLGILGNSLVIYVIMSDRRMRDTTNFFILSLAVSDLLIMLIGVEEIAHYALDKGWVLGEMACKLLRYTMTSALYASVLTLVALSAERYIAIKHPMLVRIWCTKRKTVICITLLYLGAFIFGLPTLFYLTTMKTTPGGQIHCLRVFYKERRVHNRRSLIFGYFEFVLFYLIPLITQIFLYTCVAQELSNVKPGDLRRNFTCTPHENLPHHQRLLQCAAHEQPPGSVSIDSACPKQQHLVEKQPTRVVKRITVNPLQVRKQIIKMLVACVVVYFVCYSPVVMKLFYATISGTPFKPNVFVNVVVMTMAYANSAANPILYSVFSLKFRTKFRSIFSCAKRHSSPCDPNTKQAAAKTVLYCSSPAAPSVITAHRHHINSNHLHVQNQQGDKTHSTNT